MIIQAYMNRDAVAAGGTISVCARIAPADQNVHNFTVRLFRCPDSPAPHQAVENQIVCATFPISIQGHSLSSNQTPWATGCDWPETPIAMPQSLESGLYQARIGNDDVWTDAYFILRSDPLKPKSRIVVLLPFTTAHAYSAWGGEVILWISIFNRSRRRSYSLPKRSEP